MFWKHLFRKLLAKSAYSDFFFEPSEAIADPPLSIQNKKGIPKKFAFLKKKNFFDEICVFNFKHRTFSQRVELRL